MAAIHREAIQKQIQQDWANREYIEVITGSIKKITDFLNSFGNDSNSAILKIRLWPWCLLGFSIFQWIINSWTLINSHDLNEWRFKQFSSSSKIRKQTTPCFLLSHYYPNKSDKSN